MAGMPQFYAPHPIRTQRFDINSAAVKETMAIATPCELKYFAVTIDNTDAGGATITLNKIAAGGSSSSVVATLTIPAANRQGYMFYEIPSTHVTFVPGDRVSVEVTAESVGASAYAYGMVVVQQTGEAFANLTYAVAA